MIPSRTRALQLVAIAALASCTPAPRPIATHSPSLPVASTGPVCRVGPDDGPLTSSPLIAERGIGGTGSPSTRIAERGIGGTGIIGVVTGFASICLAGREVALPPDTPIEIAGVPSGPRALRAGQVAAIEASGTADALTARRIVVRYEVSGPIEVIMGDRLQVAGQTVLLGSDTWMRIAPALGQWVAVSGLRDARGAVAATRLDLISTRTILIHGIVQRTEGRYRIGTLPIEPPTDNLLVPGLPVSVTGVYGDGGLQATTVSPDLLLADPAAYFGNYTSNFIIEGYAQPIDGQIPFGTQSFAPANSRPTGRTIAVFQRTATGDVRLGSVVASPGSAARPGGASAAPAGDGRFQQVPKLPGSGRFAPAPVPNRSFGGFGGRDDPAANSAGRLGGRDRGAGGGRSPAGGGGPPSGPGSPDTGGGGGRRR